MPKVLIVEDEESVVRAIARALRDHAEIIEALSAREARSIIEVERPFTIVTDVHLEDGSGFDVIHYARQYGAGEAALLISGDEEVVNLAWERRIDFLLKPIPGHLLVRFAAEAAQMERARDTSVSDVLESWRQKHLLTPAESEVLEAALSGGTRKELAVVLSKSQETVKTHISHLLDKTGHDSVLAMVAALLREAMDSLQN